MDVKKPGPSDILVGIDPGKSGAVCALYTQTGALCIYSLAHDNAGMLDCVALVRFFRKLKEDAAACGGAVWVCLEKLHFIPQRMGGGSIFEMARSFGAIEAVLSLLRLDNLKKVRPVDWKKYAGLIGKDKKASVDLARSLLESKKVTAVSVCVSARNGEPGSIRETVLKDKSKLFTTLAEHDKAEAFILCVLLNFNN